MSNADLNPPRDGYSAQSSLAIDVAKACNDGRLKVWFATSVNPKKNKPASRPLRIFLNLDDAAVLD